MFHRVNWIRVLSEFKLLVGFCSGEQKLYDVANLIETKREFSILKKVNGLFKMVKVDAGGYGISWNDEVDISCNELWEKGIELKQISACTAFCEDIKYEVKE